jgi:hypothetical protein
MLLPKTIWGKQFRLLKIGNLEWSSTKADKIHGVVKMLPVLTFVIWFSTKNSCGRSFCPFLWTPKTHFCIKNEFSGAYTRALARFLTGDIWIYKMVDIF